MHTCHRRKCRKDVPPKQTTRRLKRTILLYKKAILVMLDGGEDQLYIYIYVCVCVFLYIIPGMELRIRAQIRTQMLIN